MNPFHFELLLRFLGSLFKGKKKTTVETPDAKPTPPPAPAGPVKPRIINIWVDLRCSGVPLVRADYVRVADRLGVEWETLAAVAEVESNGSGCDGYLPKILFERHLFHRKTAGRYDASNPRVSNPRAGGYPLLQRERWWQLEEAMSLAPEAALESASWGKFQILGQNWRDMPAMQNVHEYVMKMARSEQDQLDALSAYIVRNDLVEKLKRRDWAGFALRYNGPGYRRNRYDVKLEKAYYDLKHQRI